MLRISIHNVAVSWLFLALFFVGNSGFAMVLHTCVKMQMKMDCCEKPSAEPKDDCSNPPLPVKAPTYKSELVCHANTIVGGLTTKAGLLEKAPNHNEYVSAFIIPANDLSIAATSTSSSSLSYAVSISPPSVEKCVLNATFLI